MGSFSIFPSSFNFSAGWPGGYGLTSSTTTQIVYDLNGTIATILTGTTFGIKFNATSSGIELDVEDTDDAGTDPALFTSNTISTAVSSGIVTVGQSIDILASDGSYRATFVVPDFGYTGGVVPASTSMVIQLYRDTSSTDKVIAFIGGGNSTQSMLYIRDSTGPRTIGYVHTQGTDTTFEWSPISTGYYELVRSIPTGFTPLASTLVDMNMAWPPNTNRRKVFSNFW